MSAGRLRLAVFFALLAALGAFVALRFRLDTDFTRYVPAGQGQTLHRLAQRLAGSAATRRMTFSVEAETPEAARRAARDLAEKLRGHPEVAWVESGPDPRLDDLVYRLYFPRRHNFASDAPEQELPKELSATGLRRRARALKEALRLPTAMLHKRIARRDPLGLFTGWLRRLEASRPKGLRIVEGSYQSRSGRALLFLATRHGPLDYEHQAPFLAAADRAIGELREKHGEGLRVRRSGINRHAVAARRSIEADVQRISLISTVAVVLLLLLVFRSPRLLALGTLPLATGVLAASGLSLALFGKIHGLTLAFGATLIGICIDYPVHYFNHALAQGDNAEGLKAVWPGLRTGAATTVVGFLFLLVSGYPGIRHVALFAATGIVSALYTTRYVLPQLMAPRARPDELSRRLAEALGRALERLGERRVIPLALLVGALAVGLWGLPKAAWDNDLRRLNSVDAALVAEDEALRRDISGIETGRLVIARGETLEAALRVNDEVARRLRTARHEGLLEGFRSLHGLLWSEDLQRRNHRALHSDAELIGRVEAALAAEGFVPRAFAPFAASLREDFAPLRWQQLAETPLGRASEAFIVPSRTATGEREVLLLTLLAGVRDGAALGRALASVEGATYLDQGQLLNRAYGAHRADAAKLLAFGLAAVWLLVLLRYRSLRLALVAGLPALLACLTTVALLALYGVPLSLMHLLSLLVVFSMGVDYGVFLAEDHGDRRSRGATLSSIIIACASSLLAFGLLALSKNPALHAVGLTIAWGLTASVLLAPATAALLRPKTPS